MNRPEIMYQNFVIDWSFLVKEDQHKLMLAVPTLQETPIVSIVPFLEIQKYCFNNGIDLDIRTISDRSNKVTLLRRV